jgi:hypothetical protein
MAQWESCKYHFAIEIFVMLFILTIIDRDSRTMLSEFIVEKK